MSPVTRTTVPVSKDDLTRAEIIDAARGLFQRFGLLKTTMEDIARAAGKGKSSLYYYYASKDEIFNEMVREDMSQVLDMVTEAVKKAETAAEKLSTFTCTKIKWLTQKRSLYSIVIGEMSENPQLIRKLKKSYESRELELLKEILAFGIKRKEFKKVTTEDLDILSFVILSSLRGIEMGVLEECPMKNIGDRLDYILDLLYHGIKR